MKGFTFAVATLLAFSVLVDAQAQNSGSAQITDFKRKTLKIYETADTNSLIETVEKSDLENGPPWDILDYSDNGMYRVKIDGRLVWVVDRSVKVDFSAMGSALNSSTVNFANPEHAGSRGYGD